MSDRSTLGRRMARGVALLLSASLGLFVVVNAQFGCDSPASNPPPADETTPSEPESKPDSEQPSELSAEPPAKPDSEPAVGEEPTPVAPANPEAQPTNVAEPVFMPASKSGGDFGSMQFPGEQGPSQQQQNPAPKK